MGDNGIILELDGVVSGYGEIEVLKGLTVQFKKGIITSIIGANGAGKSTLLRTIYGMVKVSRGSVRFSGQDMTNCPTIDVLRRGISYVPQGRCNFPMMSVQENLEMGAFTRSDPQVKGDIAGLYDRFPILKEKQYEMAGNLSGGQQQILEMAMALLLDPQLMMIDEPSMGLSPKMVDVTFDAIQQIRDAGKTILLVEQNAKKSLSISEWGIVLELGRLGLEAPASEILNDERVKRHYLGG